MIELPQALQGLSAYRQFILYELVPDVNRPGKTHKYPMNPNTHKRANAHDTDIWVDVKTAINLSQLTGYGVGFAFAESDPYFFVDIDDAKLPDGNWDSTANWLCNIFKGCAVEISQSGSGLHIIGTGQVSEQRRKKCKDYNFDIYTSMRFCALTGNSAYGDVNHNAQGPLEFICDTYLKQDEFLYDVSWQDKPSDDWAGHEDDTDLIEAAIKSKSANSLFSGGVTFKDLWECNSSKLGEYYVDDQGKNDFDHSAADQALCQHLAFWTGRNPQRIERLFRMSGLMRDKFDNRPEYVKTTVMKSCNSCSSVHTAITKQDHSILQQPYVTDSMQVGSVPQITNPIKSDAVGSFQTELRAGLQQLTIQQQKDYFSGCVYIISSHCMFTPSGDILKPATFDAVYGGYDFAINYDNSKQVKSAFEAFTQSKGANFPRANKTCFRPEHQPGAAIQEGGVTMVNVHVPIDVDMVEGNIDKFLDFVNRILSPTDDQKKLISYMAAVIQYPGVKFQWCPVIQGIQGNGKTLLSRILIHGVGEKYAHSPKADQLGKSGSTFNKWIENKKLIVIEEIHMGQQRELAETMKDMITNDRIEGQGKGSNQEMIDNRANFLLLTNHKDGALKHKNDRRYAVFFTDQQNNHDLVKAGFLDSNFEETSYFRDLYNWCKNEKGYAKIVHYLAHMKIEDKYNPATGCQRAPRTSSTDEAMYMSMGGLEHEVIEAIQQERKGFCGGFVSSIALASLLHDLRADAKIPNNKRKEFMEDLGYAHHPCLRDGRLPVHSALDGGKPRIYVATNHLAYSITDPNVLVERYEIANENAGGADYANRIFGNRNN
jgi:hypothetical protein